MASAIPFLLGWVIRIWAELRTLTMIAERDSGRAHKANHSPRAAGEFCAAVDGGGGGPASADGGEGCGRWDWSGGVEGDGQAA
jgi:hypothetical protein